MPIKQTYAQHGDACATAHAMELLGDRWTYPILRELMLGPKRFGEIASAARGVTPAVLTARLREMEHTGLVRRSQLPRSAGSVGVYEATEWSCELKPIFESLARWAQASPTRTSEGCGLTPDAAVQSMLTMAPRVPLHPSAEVWLNLYDERVPDEQGYWYRARWDDRLDISRTTDGRDATATVRADSSTWVRVLYEGLPLDAVGTEGARGDVERVVSAFRQAVATHPD